MPYKKKSDLPKQITENLPQHAQQIYLEVFNNALEQYKDPKKRRKTTEDLDEVASKVAWSAVKNRYKKNQDGKWVGK